MNETFLSLDDPCTSFTLPDAFKVDDADIVNCMWKLCYPQRNIHPNTTDCTNFEVGYDDFDGYSVNWKERGFFIRISP